MKGKWSGVGTNAHGDKRGLFRSLPCPLLKLSCKRILNEFYPRSSVGGSLSCTFRCFSTGAFRHFHFGTNGALPCVPDTSPLTASSRQALRSLYGASTSQTHPHPTSSTFNSSRMVYTSLAESQVATGEALASTISRLSPLLVDPSGKPPSLCNVMSLLRTWLQQIERTILVPRNIYEIEDFPLFLMELLRGSSSHGSHASQSGSDATHHNRFTTMSEAAILEEFEEWLWMSLPRSTAPASTDLTAEANVLNEDLSSSEVIPYVRLLGLTNSYIRYHRGVRWGPTSGSGRMPTPTDKRESSRLQAHYYRMTYDLHPWHGVACPFRRAEQMPHVHVLQWMLGRETATAKGPPLPQTSKRTQESGLDDSTAKHMWTQWHSLEPFSPQPRSPSPSATSDGFTALDVGCQSGYVTDMLLKAGASRVVAVDVFRNALYNTEATVQEHLRDKRSGLTAGGRQRVVQVQRCELLPPTDVWSEERRTVASSTTPASGDHSVVSASSGTFASAAARRRELGRRHRLSSSTDASARTRVPSVSGGETKDHAPEEVYRGPFDVLYYHPPVPSLWPVETFPSTSYIPTNSFWWRTVKERARRGTWGQSRDESVGVRETSFLSFLPCGSITQPHPHASLSSLQQLILSLIEDVTVRSAVMPPPGIQTSSLSSPLKKALLSEDGYVVMILPRFFDVQDILSASNNVSDPPALSDLVAAQLDGFYDVILRRRHHQEVRGGPIRAAANSRSHYGLVSYLFDRLNEKGGSSPGSSRATSVVDAAESSRRTPLSGAVMGDSTCASQGDKPAEVTLLFSEVDQFYASRQWIDVLVLRKNKQAARVAMASRCQQGSDPSHAFTGAGNYEELQRLLKLLDQHQLKHHGDVLAEDDGEVAGGVLWEDSFEYNEYKPKSSQGTKYHWTDLVPTYSYLEDDYYDCPTKGEPCHDVLRNFLALGHPPLLRKASVPDRPADGGVPLPVKQSHVAALYGTLQKPTADDAAREAAERFKSIFAEELRTKRRGKLRKLALTPLEQQEWFIDEKLIKSEAAKVQLMNELARWDMKDYN